METYVYPNNKQKFSIDNMTTRFVCENVTMQEEVSHPQHDSQRTQRLQ